MGSEPRTDECLGCGQVHWIRQPHDDLVLVVVPETADVAGSFRATAIIGSSSKIESIGIGNPMPAEAFENAGLSDAVEVGVWSAHALIKTTVTSATTAGETGAKRISGSISERDYLQATHAESIDARIESPGPWLFANLLSKEMRLTAGRSTGPAGVGSIGFGERKLPFEPYAATVWTNQLLWMRWQVADLSACWHYGGRDRSCQEVARFVRKDVSGGVISCANQPTRVLHTERAPRLFEAKLPDAIDGGGVAAGGGRGPVDGRSERLSHSVAIL